MLDWEEVTAGLGSLPYEVSLDRHKSVGASVCGRSCER